MDILKSHDKEFGQILGATDFSCTVFGFGQSREMKYFYDQC